MLYGTALQTLILLIVIWKTDSEAEAAQANERISAWAGEKPNSSSNAEKCSECDDKATSFSLFFL
ncbi:hypothetical protein EJB05_19172, partial [Eragrostis curvula]